VKQDFGISEVLGTLLLFAIAVLVSGLISIAAVDAVFNQAETAPIVSFAESASPNYLYHAGGDTLSVREIRIYAGGRDITKQTRINDASWEFWKTGDALHLGFYRTDEITIISRTSFGREVILYEGVKNNYVLKRRKSVKKK